MNSTAVDIVLIEDNPGDATLVREALKTGHIANTLHVLEDGEAALTYLHRQNSPRPSLILLDLNLPKKNGREVLADIKQHPHLKTIPVVVMTSSEEEADISRAYELQANCYIKKPVDFTQLLEVVHSIEDFWLRVVRLPRVQQ